MHCVRADYPTDWEQCNVYVLADLHIGDPHCDMQAVNAQINRIKDDPHGLCILNGDLLNTALKTSVSDVYGETLRPIDAIVELATLLRPIADRVIGATTGNHEARVYRNDGIDIMRLVCRELCIEDKYHPDGVLIFLRFGTADMSGRHKDKNNRQLFTIYATHGSGGGRKEGGKAIRLADMANICDADIYLMGHVHMPMVLRESYYRINSGNSSVKCVDKLFVSTAASLEYGGYGQQQQYKPSSIKNPVIRLTAKTCKAEALL